MVGWMNFLFPSIKFKCCQVEISFPIARQTASLIVSEVTAARLGFKTPDEAIGRRLFLNSQNEVRVVGVFKDYEA